MDTKTYLKMLSELNEEILSLAMTYMDRQKEVRQFQIRQVTKKIRAITGRKVTINQKGKRAELRVLEGIHHTLILDRLWVLVTVTKDMPSERFYHEMQEYRKQKRSINNITYTAEDGCTKILANPALVAEHFLDTL